MARYTKSEAREWAWENLRGQWTTLMTPFTPDDEIDEDGLRRNMRHIRSLGTRGGGCTWGMGEFWSLTREERLRVYDIVSDEAKGEWLIAAHVTHTSYKDMLALAEHAEGAGFDLLIVAPPYMVTKTEQQVVDYVRLLADNTSLAIMFYNSPQFGIVMSAQGLKQVCQIPNVVGVKEASFNQQLSIEAHTLLGKESIISTPDEWVLFKGKEMGFKQQVMFANTSDWRFDTPGRNYYVQFIDRATAGDLDLEYYDIHIRPIKEVSDRWWRRTVQKLNGSLPVPMCKYWGELMGMAGGGVRAPLADLSADEKAELKRDVESVKR
jgi:4-hydroxy-tetrahydrodipicolinate synthase